VQFELTDQTRATLEDWLAILKRRERRFLFPSRFHEQASISARQYARIFREWDRSARRSRDHSRQTHVADEGCRLPMAMWAAKSSMVASV
jgi:integrase